MRRSGIEIITQERDEQISKHGYDELRDDGYVKEELMELAHYALWLFPDDYPEQFGKEYETVLKNKTYAQRVAIVGALCAAELDRIGRAEEKEVEKSKDKTEKRTTGLDEYRKPLTKRLFANGDIVVINGSLAGSVLSAYWFISGWIYRIVVDGREAAYRVANKSFDQQDYSLFIEDVGNLLQETASLAVIERDEKVLKTVYDFVIYPGSEEVNDAD